jgi:hypothetical protein
MTRIAIDVWSRRLQAAYRDDPFHGLRRNVESVQPDEWDVQPAQWSAEVFGTDPELTICDIIAHVAGAKFMYADRAFGDASLEWADLIARMAAQSREMEAMLASLDEGHRLLSEGLASLTDDAQLAEERPAPWRLPMRRDQLIGIVTNHDLYHSGEINRQRALIRGSQGWDRGE